MAPRRLASLVTRNGELVCGVKGARFSLFLLQVFDQNKFLHESFLFMNFINNHFVMNINY